MKRISLHPEARKELLAATDRYEQERAGLGRRFRLAFEAAAGRLSLLPETYPMEYRDVRRCPILGFPYDVIYLTDPDAFWIIAVAHQHRRPRYWSQRRPG